MNKTTTIMIADREYSGWKCMDECVLPSTFNPLNQRLFTRDVIDTATGNLVYSSIRNKQRIAGVLMLEGNKSYGRTANKKRLLYKCIPDDRYLPVFLIPYEIKLGFEKNLHNKYVVFEFAEWTSAQKHPHGLLFEVLGDVGDLGAFYEYQLHCRSLNVPLTEFNTSVKSRVTSDEAIAHNIRTTPDYAVMRSNHNNKHIFTIDPAGSLDFDDAFSVEPSGENEFVISIYIANVYVWLDKLGLWQSFSKRVSTIYLPDRRRPMLPTVLSDNLCSLVAGKPRFAFVLTVRYDASNATMDWANAQFSNQEITVSANYVYDSDKMQSDPDYQTLFHITRALDRNKYDVTDSHDMVSYWMVQMNRECGERLFRERKGIFRTLKLMEKNRPDSKSNISEAARICIKNWRNTSGQYCAFDELQEGEIHEMLGVEHYAQITSPIRRLVDLLNQMMFMCVIGVPLSTEASAFLEGWLHQMDYVNAAMRSIRKVQTDCEILYKCTQNPEWKETDLDGVVFDGVQRSDGTYSYMVFLEAPRILARVYCTEKWEEHEKHKFRVFLFDDETRLCTKVRVIFSE